MRNFTLHSTIFSPWPYTDDDFKQSINYKEDTGYSIMDGGAWEIRHVEDLEGNQKKYSIMSNSPIFMYTSAKNPLSNMSSVINELLGNSFFNVNRTQGNPNAQLNPTPPFGPLRDGYKFPY